MLNFGIERKTKTVLYKPYNIFPKNYNFLEKYIWLCYTTSIERFGEKHETRDLIRTDR